MKTPDIEVAKEYTRAVVFDFLLAVLDKKYMTDRAWSVARSRGNATMQKPALVGPYC